MKLKFKCKYCGEHIIAKDLKVGEMIECKNCGAKNEIPKSAVATDDTPVSEDGPQSTKEPTKIKGIHVLLGIFLLVVVFAIFSYIQHPKDIKYLSPLTSIPSSTKTNGVKIVSINSGWDWSGGFLCPHLKIKFRNISYKDIDRLAVKATFIDTLNHEIFGDAFALVIGYGDTPLRPDYSKTAYLNSNVGYESDMVTLDFPNLVAEVYVNDELYEKVPISKKYAGVDWGKK
jgi:hypothetical protein